MKAGSGRRRMDRDSQEQVWLGGLRHGDEAAFAALYERHQGSIYRYALRMTGSEALAEEATQETFLALIEGKHKYDAARGPLVGYLFGIARHAVYRALRSALPAAGEDEPFWTPDYSEELDRMRLRDQVWSTVLALPPHYREAVVLCELEELGYAEAAALLGCPVGTVRSRLSRAKTMLVERWKTANCTI
jgi:RNA polymerase sigma-70 factor (ECF subfamily)